MNQSDSTRALVTSNGGLTKPTQAQPPSTTVPKIGADAGNTPQPASTNPTIPATKGDSLTASFSGRAKMLAASAQSVQSTGNAQVLDLASAISQTSATANGFSSQAGVSLLAQANATPEIALRLLE